LVTPGADKNSNAPRCLAHVLGDIPKALYGMRHHVCNLRALIALAPRSLEKRLLNREIPPQVAINQFRDPFEVSKLIHRLCPFELAGLRLLFGLGLVRRRGFSWSVIFSATASKRLNAVAGSTSNVHAAEMMALIIQGLNIGAVCSTVTPL
jgi:hypothetical protein